MANLPPQGKTHGPLWSADLLAWLGMDGVTEEQMDLLQNLKDQDMPLNMKEWVHRNLPIGFPDNGVWSAVSQMLDTLPSIIDAAVEKHGNIDRRIEKLQSVLARLQAEQKGWHQYKDSLETLRTQSLSFQPSAHLLSQVEQNISIEATQELIDHMASCVSNPEEDTSTQVLQPMSSEAWTVILRAAGLSPLVEEQAGNVDQLLFGSSSLKWLPEIERCDVRFLKDSIKRGQIPFIHPFYERYELNSQRNQPELPSSHVSEHECAICDCTSSSELVNLLREYKSPLAELDWMKHGINGPQMIMLRNRELRSLFGLSSKEATPFSKAVRFFRKKHHAA